MNLLGHRFAKYHWDEELINSAETFGAAAASPHGSNFYSSKLAHTLLRYVTAGVASFPGGKKVEGL